MFRGAREKSLSLNSAFVFPADLSPSEARRVQERVPPAVIRRDRLGRVRTVAGADIALRGDNGYAAVILYSFPDLVEIERVSSSGKLKFPYVPGLLAFREIPLLLEAFASLRNSPDLILADAHGWAHPRRAGMACHLGLVLDIPTIGCAKSVLVGQYKMPAAARGSTAALWDKKPDKKPDQRTDSKTVRKTDAKNDQTEVIGRVVRTRAGVKPVFVSCGHRVSLPTAVRLVLACSDGYRIPKPQREADHWVKHLRG